jgi:hypothetical protein
VSQPQVATSAQGASQSNSKAAITASRLPDIVTLLVLRLQDEHTGAKTVLYSIEVDRGCSWAAAQQLLSDAAMQSSPVRVQPPGSAFLLLH